MSEINRHKSGETPEEVPPSLVAVERGEIDRVFTALANQRRRYALYSLRNEEQASLHEVTKQVAAWEHSCPADALSKTTYAEVRIDLVHAQLPQLQRSGLIDYDQRSEEIVLSHPSRLVTDCLDHCASRELSD